MFFLRTSLILLCIGAFVASAAIAQNAPGKSVLQPNRVYECSIEKTYKGNDGTQDVPATQSFRRLVITTGAVSAAGLEVTLEVLRPRADGNATGPASRPDWKGTFTLGFEGAIGDVKQIDGEGGMKDKSMQGFLSRQLASVLFNPEYDFKMKPALTIAFTPVAGKAGEFSYTMTEDPNVVIPEEQGMTVARGGTATFDAKDKIFTRNEYHETSRIAVAPTATDPAKEVVVATTTITTIRVKSN